VFRRLQPSASKLDDGADQLLELKWLGEHGAGPDACRRLARPVRGCHDHHRQFGVTRIQAQELGEPVPIQARHHQVEDDHVRFPAVQHIERLGAVRSRLHGAARFPQCLGYQAAQRWLIVYDKHAHIETRTTHPNRQSV
jgi:hypothetical protein